MRAIANYLDILIHILKIPTNCLRYHEIRTSYIDNSKYFYCRCGYKKPEKVYVKI